MRLSNIKWPVVFISCLLCFSEEAILRPYRRLANMLANVDGELQDMVQIHENEGRLVLDGNNSKPAHTGATGHFQPSPQRCCQTGERVAKKKMVCDVAVLAVVRKHKDAERQKTASSKFSNRPVGHIQRGRHLQQLSDRVAKCSVAFPKYFVKCCIYQEEFDKHRKKCQQRPKRQRRKCKQIIKKRYT